MSKILLNRSNQPGKKPDSSQLDIGEVALNYYDGDLYFKNDEGLIAQINANNAHFADKANKDGEGNIITDVYASKQHVGDLVNKRVLSTGDRGQLAGYYHSTSLQGSQTITKDSSDCVIITTSGATTLTFTPAEESIHCSKVIVLKATSETALTISGATWSNMGSMPAWGSVNSRLILIANFICGDVVLSTFDISIGK